MLTKLRLKNFKSWDKRLWDEGIRLAPISLFLGPNSAGKTSILQAPLLLKQTFESSDRALDLNFGGQHTDLIDLGSFDSIIHRNEAKSELGLGFTLKVQLPDPAFISYEATYQTITGGSPALHRLELGHKRQNRVYTSTRQAKGGYLLEAPEYESKEIAGRVDAKRTYQPERSLSFSSDALDALGPRLAEEVQDFSKHIRQYFAQIAYLGPLREPPGRSYMWSGSVQGDLGRRGEYAVHALLASLNTHTKQKQGQEGGKNWLVDRVSYWLKKLGVADGLVLERQGTRHYELMVVRGTQRANIVDVGFGVSQVLPILVLSYLVPRGSTIITEEPEIHLHPLAQSGLAELIAEVAMTRQVQFLVETHSEHLFRRLQTLIASEQLSANACRLYFVDQQSSSCANLTGLELDDFGRVSNWPKHFFGDTLGETEQQVKHFIERSRKPKRSDLFDFLDQE